VIRAVALAALVVAGDPATLAVRTADGTVAWWRSDQAPVRWQAAHPAVTRALRWRRGASGVEWSELALRAGGEAWHTRVIVARLDPRRVRFDVQWGVDSTARSTWSVSELDSDVVFAVNAGQFTAALPWGWVVADGRERLSPGRGPLSSAFVVTRDGAVRFVNDDALDAVRRIPGVVAAFQSYPTLLRGDGVVPPMVRDPCAIDCTHRDARVALGVDHQGRVLVALTRFDAAGEALGFLPLGLTVTETAALMGALGARQAVLLDGGISAQMLVRDAAGAPHSWRGVRRVPLGLVARVR